MRLWQLYRASYAAVGANNDLTQLAGMLDQDRLQQLNCTCFHLGGCQIAVC